MSMLVLDTVTKSLRVKLAATQTSAPVQLTSHWADSTVNGTLLVEDSTLVNSNGLTSVELVASPAASTKRDIKTISAVNNDSVPQTVVIYVLDGGVEHDVFRKTLTARQSWNSAVVAGSGGGGGGGGGSGDMLKSTYDPNTDGIIDIPQGGTNAITAAAARTNLGLGTAAVYGVGLTTGTVAPGNTKLDDWAAPDDNIDLNVSLSAHGLAPKGTTGTTQYWRQDWTLGTPSGTAGGGGLYIPKVSSYDLIKINSSKSAQGAGDPWVGTVNQANPTHSPVTVSTSTGALVTIAPETTYNWGKIVIRNTTRGNEALISFISGSAMWFDSDTPLSTWVNGDALTSLAANEQTGARLLDLSTAAALAIVPANAIAIDVEVCYNVISNWTAGDYAEVHPDAVYAGASGMASTPPVGGVWFLYHGIIPLINKRLGLRNLVQNASGAAAVILRVRGYLT